MRASTRGQMVSASLRMRVRPPHRPNCRLYVAVRMAKLRQVIARGKTMLRETARGGARRIRRRSQLGEEPMGPLDGAVGDMAGSLLGGQGGNQGRLAVALHLVQQQGGLEALGQTFQAGGLGDVGQSWVGTGANASVSGARLEQVLAPRRWRLRRRTRAWLPRRAGRPRLDAARNRESADAGRAAAGKQRSADPLPAGPDSRQIARRFDAPRRARVTTGAAFSWVVRRDLSRRRPSPFWGHRAWGRRADSSICQVGATKSSCARYRLCRLSLNTYSALRANGQPVRPVNGSQGG
jgi:hypothetical protein